MPSTSLLHQKRLLVSRFRTRGYPEYIIEAFLRVPREAFISMESREHSYQDTPLPIEHGQRLSQPTTLLTMLTLLAPERGHKVLEVGSGSGYLSCWLAEIGCHVVGVEIIPELAVAASSELEELGYSDRVTIYAGDGSGGWEADAPYDRIIVSGGMPEVPRHLVAQLNDRGRIVVPVGIGETRMILLEKGPFDSAQGEPLKGVQEDVKESDYGSFLFSPITGKYGVKEEVWEIG